MDIGGLLLLDCLCREGCASIASLCAIRRHREMGSRSQRRSLSSAFTAFTFIIHLINYHIFTYINNLIRNQTIIYLINYILLHID